MKNIFKRISLVFLFSAGLFLNNSCNDFLNGSELLNEIEKKIDYETAPVMTVRILPSSADMGYVVGETEKKLKVSDTFEIGFSATANYKFSHWAAYLKNSNEPVNDYLEFTDSKNTETKVKVLKYVEELIVRPVCDKYQKQSSVSPNWDQGVLSRDTSIIINFSEDISDDSFFYTQRELVELGYLASEQDTEPSSSGVVFLKDENQKIYGYRLFDDDKEITFKNIKVTSESENLLQYFGAPEISEKQLIIPVASGKYIPVEQNETKTIEIILSKNIASKGTGISMANDYQWKYKINASTGAKLEVSVTVDDPNKGTVIAGEGSYSSGQIFALNFLASNEYQFDCWEYDKTKVSVADENAATTTATALITNTAVTIKAVCRKQDAYDSTPPVLSGFEVAKTQLDLDSGNYFTKENSTAWTEVEFNRNLASTIAIKINAADDDSGIDQIVVSEKLKIDQSGNEVTRQPVQTVYNRSDFTAESYKNVSTVINHIMNVAESGIVELTLSLKDKNGNLSQNSADGSILIFVVRNLLSYDLNITNEPERWRNEEVKTLPSYSNYRASEDPRNQVFETEDFNNWIRTFRIEFKQVIYKDTEKTVTYTGDNELNLHYGDTGIAVTNFSVVQAHKLTTSDCYGLNYEAEIPETATIFANGGTVLVKAKNILGTEYEKKAYVPKPAEIIDVCDFNGKNGNSYFHNIPVPKYQYDPEGNIFKTRIFSSSNKYEGTNYHSNEPGISYEKNGIFASYFYPESDEIYDRYDLSDMTEAAVGEREFRDIKLHGFNYSGDRLMFNSSQKGRTFRILGKIGDDFAYDFNEAKIYSTSTNNYTNSSYYFNHYKEAQVTDPASETPQVPVPSISNVDMAAYGAGYLKYTFTINDTYTPAADEEVVYYVLNGTREIYGPDASGDSKTCQIITKSAITSAKPYRKVMQKQAGGKRKVLSITEGTSWNGTYPSVNPNMTNFDIEFKNPDCSYYCKENPKTSARTYMPFYFAMAKSGPEYFAFRTSDLKDYDINFKYYLSQTKLEFGTNDNMNNNGEVAHLYKNGQFSQGKVDKLGVLNFYYNSSYSFLEFNLFAENGSPDYKFYGKQQFSSFNKDNYHKKMYYGLPLEDLIPGKKYYVYGIAEDPYGNYKGIKGTEVGYSLLENSLTLDFSSQTALSVNPDSDNGNFCIIYKLNGSKWELGAIEMLKKDDAAGNGAALWNDKTSLLSGANWIKYYTMDGVGEVISINLTRCALISPMRYAYIGSMDLSTFFKTVMEQSNGVLISSNAPAIGYIVCSSRNRDLNGEDWELRPKYVNEKEIYMSSTNQLNIYDFNTEDVPKDWYYKAVIRFADGSKWESSVKRK